MPEIRCLDPHLADLIAAGEVVERPASVVKELVENAVDAGASAVTVEIRRGGMELIRVSDNGCGISPAQLPTAFLRHATSKLRKESDLAAIGTLGFRGEALAAIAAVSYVDIVSRERSGSGASLRLTAGLPEAVEEQPAAEGTVISVRELFFNTPARLKFMKKDSAETAAVHTVLQQLALSHPELSLRFVKDGQEMLHTPGDGKLISAVYAALGRDFALSLTEVRGSGGSVRCEGFVTKPLAGRGSRSMQVFFVNGRLVKSPVLTAALEEGYRNRLLKGKFPGCVLHLTLPTEEVDVNVHPAKTVVKFLHEKAVFDAVYYTVLDALEEKKPVTPAKPAAQQSNPRGDFYQTMSAADFRKSAETKQADPFRSAAKPAESKTPAAQSFSITSKRVGAPVSESAAKTVETPAAQSFSIAPKRAGASAVEVAPKRGESHGLNPAPKAPTFTKDEPAPFVTKVAPVPSPAAALRAEDSASPFYRVTPVATRLVEKSGEEKTVTAAPAPVEMAAEAPVEQTALPMAEQQTMLSEEVPWRVAGEVLKTYIICEDEVGTVHLIDKHAAHERILFDKLKAGEHEIMSQLLLVPVAADIGADACAALLERQELLEEFGFRCEDFGPGSLLVREIPADIDGADAAAALEMLAEEILSCRSTDPRAARDAMLHTIACKAAIKAGMSTSEKELRELVKKVQSGEVQYCPHGRPVEASLTKYQLEKMFRRA
ncbi:MAG: DNA mismatch repair endonuclease MutL [Oscillospiraceae bacterium]|nr:DNA mismatch repair endonuclease MutL [Oscillospiraceae bacterium]